MLVEPRTVRRIAREIADAADGAFDSYRSGRVLQEPQITDRILGAIEDRLRNRKVHGITWEARTLQTGRGISAEERRHGADLMGVLDIDVQRFKVTKGFLAQAKKAEPGVPFLASEWNRLVAQCNTMLNRTPDAFVTVYSRDRGIRMFPAAAVIASGSRDLFELYDRSLSGFFESHIECFIGDTRLDSTDISTLDVLAELPVRRVLQLSARRG